MNNISTAAADGILHRKKRSWKFRLFTGVGTVFLVCVFIFVVLSLNMRPAMASFAKARINALATRAANQAILDCMADEESYAGLIQVRDTGDQVYMLQADTRAMNLLAADCCTAAQLRISELGDQGISIPVGTISGISFLAGKGPKINVHFQPAGSVQSEFHSEFISSGINQTLYRVKLMLFVSVKLVMPGVSESIGVSAEAAIAECILVGDVPQVYTNVASEEDMLNLIPTDTP